MPIRPIFIQSWTGRKLRKGDAISCLELLQQVKRLVAANSAGSYLKADFDWGDLEQIRALIGPLEAAAHAFYARQEGAQRPSESKTKDLQELRQIEKRLMQLHAEVTRSCNPLKIFLDDHIDSALQHVIDHVSTDTDMPIHKQVRMSMGLIADKCLGDPVSTRKMLVDRFKMGTATTAADVVTALDNMGIIRDQLQVHYDTVSNAVDEAATIRARTFNEDAEEVYGECQPPPTRQEMITFLQDTLDVKSPEIGSIVAKFYELQDHDWDQLVPVLKTMAEKMAGASDRAAKRPRLGEDSGESKSSSGGGSSGGGKGSSGGGSSGGGSSQHLAAAAQDFRPYHQQYGPPMQYHHQHYGPPPRQQQYNYGPPSHHQQQQQYESVPYQQQQYGPPPHSAPPRPRTPSPSRTRPSGPGTPY